MCQYYTIKLLTSIATIHGNFGDFKYTVFACFDLITYPMIRNEASSVKLAPVQTKFLINRHYRSIKVVSL
jgi:hypothetical protein